MEQVLVSDVQSEKAGLNKVSQTSKEICQHLSVVSDQLLSQIQVSVANYTSDLFEKLLARFKSWTLKSTTKFSFAPCVKQNPLILLPKAGISSTKQELSEDLKMCRVLYSCYQIVWAEEIAQPAVVLSGHRYMSYKM